MKRIGKQVSPLVISTALMTSDVFALFVGFGLSVMGLLWYGNYSLNSAEFAMWLGSTGKPQFLVFWFFSVLVVVNFWFFGLYTKRSPFWDELLHVLRILFYTAITHGVVVLVARWPFSRFVWLFSWGCAMALVPIFRSLMKSGLRSIGWWQKPTVILGSGQNALQAYRAIQSEPGIGFEVIGFISVDGAIDLPAPVQNVKADEVLPLLSSLFKPHLLVAFSQAEMQKHSDLVQRLTLRYKSFSWIPDVMGLPSLGMDINHFFSHEVLLLNVRNNLANPFARMVKRIFDILASVFMLIVLSPLFAVLALQIRKTKGPIFYGHNRVGRGGKKFPCYKFRTMVPQADFVLEQYLDQNPEARHEWEREFKLKKDPRVTQVGYFLRKWSLDELPQLWNVLIGDMSLVGPRPVTEPELSKYSDRVDFYLAARPGITGLWQVSGRNDISYDARTHLDAWYVKNWNLWYDIAILFKTISVVFGKRGAY